MAMASPSDSISRAIIFGFGLVLAALMVFLVWVGRYADQQETALAHPILQKEVTVSVADLRGCMNAYRLNGLALSGRWEGEAGDPGGTRGYNHASGLRVAIRDNGKHRSVEIATSRGRPLQSAERDQINGCLAAAGG